ncbi:PREDICTED: uncharacterized protein LOC105315639, partial [Amphimedon queenslandica]|uniref:Glycosyltransferase family 92 protein n=2 Tax=Amphimedon queenslandica TaxID=400682 RepID=A0AAN0IST6_AMPQE
ARRMAYFDTRDPNYPAVAFITMHDDREKIKPLIYARLVYDDGSSVCTRLEYWGHSGELDLRHGVRELYVHYLMRNTKMIDSSLSPISATLTTDSTCSGGHSKTILIKDTRKQKSNYDFGVCLHQALYNLTDPQLLVDWVELNIALGAKVITVYLQDVSESYYELMLPYIGRGVVEVLDWKMGIPYIKEYTKIWGQTGVISECIFRNINRVKYLGLMDVDEFFVPQKHLTIPEMLLDLEKMAGARNSASFILYNAFMWNDGIPLPEVAHSTKCPGMKWPRYFMNTKRSCFPPYQYKYHKLIVKPLAVNTAWCHYIFEPWQKGYTKEFYVPIKLGLTHHYRFPEKKTKSWKSQTFTMSRYFEVTRKGIMKQMCHANY